MFAEEEIVRDHKDRAHIIINLVLFAFFIVLSRLWYLQIMKGRTLYEYSLQNSLRKEVIRAPRGIIFDRNNSILVDNAPRFDLVITPQFLTGRKQTIDKLSHLINVDSIEIESILNRHKNAPSYRAIIIKKNLSREEVSLVETELQFLPGVSVETFITREYIDSEISSHVLGHISEIDQDQLEKYKNRDQHDYKLGDFIGQFGLEEKLDSELRGENGLEYVEVDAFGRKRRNQLADSFFKIGGNDPARPGHNVRLTIDRDLQKVAFQSLQNKSGSLVAIDIHNGQVLAMVSNPGFNPSMFSRGLSHEYWSMLSNNPAKPMRNRAIQDHYAPGSVFKTVTLIAALEENIIDANTKVNCSGNIKFGTRQYHCWRKHGHGAVDVYGALRESCDVFFYRIAQKIDIDVISQYAAKLGLGKKTGLALASEASGLLPTKAWKEKRFGVEWQLGETLSCAIGQSYMLATPIQLANAYAAIYNGGKIFKPYLVKEVFNNLGEVLNYDKPILLSENTFRSETLKIIHRGLYEVVNHPKGTVWWKRDIGSNMAGKTGTSQVIRLSSEKLYSKCEDAPYQSRHHGLFVGVAPVENPQIAVAAVVEHGCSGSGAAAPIVIEVVKTYMQKYHSASWQKNFALFKKTNQVTSSSAAGENLE